MMTSHHVEDHTASSNGPPPISPTATSATEFYWSSDHNGVRAHFALAADSGLAYMTLGGGRNSHHRQTRSTDEDDKIVIPSWKPLLRPDIVGFDHIISPDTQYNDRRKGGVFEAVTCKDIPLTGTQLQSLYEDTIPEVHDDVDTSTFLPDPDNTPMWLGDEGSDDDGSEDMTGWEPRPKLFIKLKEPRLVDVVGFMYSPWDRNFGRRVYPTYSLNGVDYFSFLDSGSLYASIPRIGNLNRGNPSLHTPKVLEMHRHQPVMVKYIRLEFPNGCGRRLYSVCVCGPIWWPKVRDIVTGLALVQQGRATLIPDTVKQALEEDGKTLSEAIATLPVDSLWSPVLAGALQKLAFTTNTQSASYRLPQTTMYILSFL